MRYDKKTLADINFENKKVIVRLDLNVPIKDGKITNDKRIVAALDTLKYLIDKNSKIIVLSHLGRIKTNEDKKNPNKSLKVVANRLAELLPNVEVSFLEENVGKNVEKAVNNMKPGSIIVLENTRFNDVDNKGNQVKLESKNDKNLGKFWASLADVYVNDAFGTAHRDHASNVGIASNINDSCVGFLIQKELEMLATACDTPRKPLVAILGGAKISDKIKTIYEIAKNADLILIGGAMAFTFEKARGLNVGKSLVDTESLDVAKKIMNDLGDKLVLPIDALYATEISENAKVKNIITGSEFDQNLIGLDIGKKTTKLFIKKLKTANTVIWNGPLGYTEIPKFAKGTNKICKQLSKLQSKGVFTLIGGGDSAAAAIKMGYENNFSHISTGGGASLAYLEGSSLPGIESIPNKGEIKEIKKEKPVKKQSVKKPTNKKKTSSKKTAPKKEEQKSIEVKIVSEKQQNKKEPAKKNTSKKSSTIKNNEVVVEIKNTNTTKPNKKTTNKKEQPKKQSRPKKALIEHKVVDVKELDNYNFHRRREIWKTHAGHNVTEVKCYKCNKIPLRKSIKLSNGKHINYRCWISNPNK